MHFLLLSTHTCPGHPADQTLLHSENETFLTHETPDELQQHVSATGT